MHIVIQQERVNNHCCLCQAGRPRLIRGSPLWRRGRDLNPRSIAAHALSRRARSAGLRNLSAPTAAQIIPSCGLVDKDTLQKYVNEIQVSRAYRKSLIRENTPSTATLMPIAQRSF